jgi:hypothetical protein
LRFQDLDRKGCGVLVHPESKGINKEIIEHQSGKDDG